MYMLRARAAPRARARARGAPQARAPRARQPVPQVAERFLRERRERGELPVRDTREMQARLREPRRRRARRLRGGQPAPVHAALAARAQRASTKPCARGLGARPPEPSGRRRPTSRLASASPPEPTSEPHSPEPLEIDLGDGRTLRYPARSTASTRRPTGGSCFGTTRPAARPGTTAGSSGAASSSRSPSTCWPQHGCSRTTPSRRRSSTTWTADARSRSTPPSCHGEGFRSLLRGLVDAIAQGGFLQEPAACDLCDFTSRCADPQPLVERRRRYKIRDPRLQAVLRLRDVG